MTSSDGLVPGIARDAARPFAFAWNSWRALTARQIGYAALALVVLGGVQGIGNAIASPYVWWRAFLSDFYDNLILVAVLLPSLAVAVRVTPRRVPRWLPYVVAATMPFVVGSLLPELPALLLVVFGGSAADWPGFTSPAPVDMWTHIPPTAVLTLLLVIGFMFAREAQQRADALRQVQLDAARVARRAYQSRLQATQARVEPQFLFDTLRQVEALYETDAVNAERMLDDLIAYLRAALPNVNEPSSTIATELALARAWLDIQAIRLPGRLQVGLVIAEDANDARMPPMVLLPLLALATEPFARSADTSGSIGITTTLAAGKLRVVLSSSDAVFLSGDASPVSAQVRERLRALYGADASLAFGPDGSGGSRAIVEVPHERDRTDAR